MTLHLQVSHSKGVDAARDGELAVDWHSLFWASACLQWLTQRAGPFVLILALCRADTGLARPFSVEERTH